MIPGFRDRLQSLGVRDVRARWVKTTCLHKVLPSIMLKMERTRMFLAYFRQILE